MDKEILQVLQDNCRISYQDLARKFHVSSNTIKRRINKLLESGIIIEFDIALSMSMVGVHTLLGLVYTNGLENDMKFLELVGSHPSVVRAGYDSFGVLVIRAEFEGVKGLSDLSSYLRGLDGVDRVELHPNPESTGKIIELSMTHLQVLHAIVDDPRMPVTHISEKTGLTTKRIRKSLTELYDSGAIRFYTNINLNAGGCTSFVLRTNWDERVTNAQEIIDTIKTRYPDEYWSTRVSASESIMWLIFVVNHIRESEPMIRFVREMRGVTLESTIVAYPQKVFPGIRQQKLRDLFIQAGLET
ncbi:MAG: winged helix-turn-helix transcriptional regulator [Candidatus Thorarchaeota archaeon]